MELKIKYGLYVDYVGSDHIFSALGQKKIGYDSATKSAIVEINKNIDKLEKINNYINDYSLSAALLCTIYNVSRFYPEEVFNEKYDLVLNILKSLEVFEEEKYKIQAVEVLLKNFRLQILPLYLLVTQLNYDNEADLIKYKEITKKMRKEGLI